MVRKELCFDGCYEVACLCSLTSWKWMEVLNLPGPSESFSSLAATIIPVIKVLQWHAIWNESHSSWNCWQGPMRYASPHLPPAAPHHLTHWILTVPETHQALSSPGILYLLFPLPRKFLLQIPLWLAPLIPSGVCSNSTLLLRSPYKDHYIWNRGLSPYFLFTLHFIFALALITIW